MHEEDDEPSQSVEIIVAESIPSTSLVVVPKARRDGAGMGRRNQTESFRRMTVGEREEIKRWLPIYDEYASTRPKTRGDCANVPRPCPWSSCRHNLYLDVRGSGPTAGEAIVYNFPDLEPHEVPSDRSCALDIADRGGATLGDVAKLTNLTRERIRQVQEKALSKIKRVSTRGVGLDQFVDDLDINKEPSKIVGAQRLFGKEHSTDTGVDPEYSEPDEHDHDLTLGDGDTLSFFSKHPRTDYFITARIYRIYMRESVEHGFQKRKLTKRQLSGEVEPTAETDMKKVSEIDLRSRHNDGMTHRKSKSIPSTKTHLTSRQEDVLRAYTDLEIETGRIPNNVEIAKLLGIDVTTVARDRQVLIRQKMVKPARHGKTPKAVGAKVMIKPAAERVKRKGTPKRKGKKTVVDAVITTVAKPALTVQGPAATIVQAIHHALAILDVERTRLVQALKAMSA